MSAHDDYSAMETQHGAELALLRAWARQLDAEPYAAGLALDALRARWAEGPVLLALPTIADEIDEADAALPPAWIPDETWPHGYHEMRRGLADRTLLGEWALS